MAIVLACDSFLSLRNVRNGELGRRLQELTGERVIVLVDPAQFEGSQAACPEGVELGRLLEFSAYSDPTLEALMTRAYLTRKSYYDPATLWSKVIASCYAGKGRWLPLRLVKLARERLRLWRYARDGRRGLAAPRRQAFASALRRHAVADQYRRLFSKWEAHLVVAFSLEGPREMVLMEAANSVGLPTAVMIRSRDNLAAKIQHLPDALAYLVWSDLTRGFLHRIYPEIPAERVHVTGSPQFDRHLDPRFRLGREEFFRLVGLDPQRPLVVYTCATPTLIPHEIDIVQYLADAVASGGIRRGPKRAQLLIRGHPRGFGASVPLLRHPRRDVAVFPPPGTAEYHSEAHEAQVVRLILEDEPVHLATLAYQDVQVNVSGTMTVDSAILDKPVVNVFFDLPVGIPPGRSVRRFYQRSDYRPIVESGGVRLAHTPEECVTLINQYLENPALDAPGRKWIRENDCGPLDGRAGERIANVLTTLLGSRTS
jgi:hypothetical protein